MKSDLWLYQNSVSREELVEGAEFLNNSLRAHSRYGYAYVLILPGVDELLENETLRLLPVARRYRQNDFFLIIGLDERRDWVEARVTEPYFYLPCERHMMNILCRLHAVYPYRKGVTRPAVCLMEGVFDICLRDLMAGTEFSLREIAGHVILCMLDVPEDNLLIGQRRRLLDRESWGDSFYGVEGDVLISRGGYLDACADRIRQNPSVSKEDSLVLFGVMATTTGIMERLSGYHFVGFIDNDEQKEGTEVAGLPVCRPADARQFFGKDIRIVVSSKYCEEMCEQLLGLGYRLGKDILVAYVVNKDTAPECICIDALNEMLQTGEEEYRRLRAIYPSETFLHLPYSGTGDALLAGIYLEQFCEEHEIDSYVFLTNSRACAGVLQLFGVEHVLIQQQASDNLIKYVRAIGFEQANYVILNDCYEQESVANIRGRSNLDFHTMFRLCVFRTEHEINRPVFKSLRSSENLMKDNSLHEGRTVLLAPYAVTMPGPSVEVWEGIAEILKAAGLDVCTNIGSSSEQPVRDTRGVFIPFDQLPDFVHRAGFFVGTRSGLCDIIASVDALKIVFYVNRLDTMGYVEGRAFTYFSLQRMRLADDRTEELVFEEGDDHWLVEAVVNKVIETQAIREDPQGLFSSNLTSGEAW